MAYKTRKRKVKKNVPEGIANIHSTFNNTIITITDLDGNVISWASAGAIGYKGIGFKTVFLDNDYVFLQTGTFSFRFDRKRGTSKDVPINTPWQIYPFWTPIESVDQSIRNAFNHDQKDLFRVKFALKPRNSKILTDRSRKDNYIDLFNAKIELLRPFYLFLKFIKLVSILVIHQLLLLSVPKTMIVGVFLMLLQIMFPKKFVTV